MPIAIPTKPFPNFKWRWAVYTPTESLNYPPTFIGILRVLLENEGNAFSSTGVNEGLEIVQDELQTQVNLIRSQERNIFRNSGQYWKAFGLLIPTSRGRISLSQFGRDLAEGKISHTEFATTVIKSLELPNKNIESESNLNEWSRLGFKIKPLELILKILAGLENQLGNNQSFITPEELIKITIPLSGVNASFETHINALIEYRNDTLDISSWPDCAPEANDKRMAREFLIFLGNYGFCKVQNGGTNLTERYALASISAFEVEELSAIEIGVDQDISSIEDLIKRTQITANIERKRVVREVLERPNQNLFRRSILEAFNQRCIITNVQLKSVLEAGHIKPIKYQGSDEVTNGLCLRADIHTLFDNNHLKITPTGNVVLSDEANRRENYGELPDHIDLPEFVNVEMLEWRMKYY